MTEELVRNLEKIPAALKLINENKLQNEGEASSEVIMRGVENLVAEKKLAESAGDR